MSSCALDVLAFNKSLVNVFNQTTSSYVTRCCYTVVIRRCCKEDFQWCDRIRSINTWNNTAHLLSPSFSPVHSLLIWPHMSLTAWVAQCNYCSQATNVWLRCTFCKATVHEWLYRADPKLLKIVFIGTYLKFLLQMEFVTCPGAIALLYETNGLHSCLCASTLVIK